MIASIDKSANQTIAEHKHWKRMIVLMDMNAFFASVEQMDRPDWQGRPVAITNGKLGSTIITCSYEARAWGVKTGMRLRQGRELCPNLIQAPSRPERYAEISTRIMRSLIAITPDIEVFSVDEAFLDVTGVQHLWGTAEQIGLRVKRTVLQASGVLCSVGISGDKTTAKYAAKLKKPDGLTVIPPWEAEATLKDVAVTELCGVNKGIGNYLAARGVFTCGEMKSLPAGELGRRFGNPGRRVWLMAQGKDPMPLIQEVPPPKSVGHGKVIPPNTKDRETLLLFFQHMSEKVAARLRRHELKAKNFFIGFNTNNGWVKGRSRTEIAMDDGLELYLLCKVFLDRHWQGNGVFQVQVTALDPSPEGSQLDLFTQCDERKDRLNHAMDDINLRYGEFALSPARLVNRSEMPNVIAPAFGSQMVIDKPFCHKQDVMLMTSKQKSINS